MGTGLRATMVGTVLHLILDAPERRNALSRPMLEDLAAAVLGVEQDVTGVVVSGASAAFSSGADFRELTGTSVDVTYDDAVAAATRAVVAAPRVVVAAIEGPCLGAAADLALACDLRVAGQGAYLQVPAARLGVLYNPEAVGRLGRRLPTVTVRRLLLLGERFADEEALQAGLVSHVVPRGEAVERAVEMLAGVSADELDAIAATKGLLTALETSTYDPMQWEDRRRALLDAPARAAVIARAHQPHSVHSDEKS